MSEITKAKIGFWLFFILTMIFGYLTISVSYAAIGPLAGSAFAMGWIFETARHKEAEE